jgi:hypothetical protein
VHLFLVAPGARKSGDGRREPPTCGLTHDPCCGEVRSSSATGTGGRIVQGGSDVSGWRSCGCGNSSEHWLVTGRPR